MSTQVRCGHPVAIISYNVEIWPFGHKYIYTGEKWSLSNNWIYTGKI